MIPFRSIPTGAFSQYRVGQDYVLSALPSLLQATAYHPDRLRESVITLRQLTRRPSGRGGHDGGASGCSETTRILAALR